MVVLDEAKTTSGSGRYGSAVSQQGSPASILVAGAPYSKKQDELCRVLRAESRVLRARVRAMLCNYCGRMALCAVRVAAGSLDHRAGIRLLPQWPVANVVGQACHAQPLAVKQ